jgi:hypothetical protein
LDGTTDGEQAIEELLELLISKGVAALNIVPDRNWNVADSAERAVKVDNLYRVVDLAQQLDLPLNIGTEMNSFGQKLVDDFDAPELGPLREPFLNGANFVYGHTVLQRGSGIGYQSEWCRERLPARCERNAFYTRAGESVQPGKRGHATVSQLDVSMSPDQILSQLRE